MAFRQITFSLLLLIGTASVSALANGGGFSERLGGYVFYTQKAGMEQDRPESDRRVPPSQEPQRQERGFPETSGSGVAPENGADQSSADAGSRRRQPLSPEERRALRRQIDEAGHDIYQRKR